MKKEVDAMVREQAGPCKVAVVSRDVAMNGDLLGIDGDFLFTCRVDETVAEKTGVLNETMMQQLRVFADRRGVFTVLSADAVGDVVISHVVIDVRTRHHFLLQ